MSKYAKVNKIQKNGAIKEIWGVPLCMIHIGILILILKFLMILRISKAKGVYLQKNILYHRLN